METKRVVTLVAFGLLLAAGFLLYILIYTKQPPIQGMAIGNNRDEHGCIEGYSWNQTAYSCMRANLTEIIYQVLDFKSCSDAGYAIDENNQTSLLQCHALNGTIFVQNMTGLNITKTNNTGIVYPDSITLSGNFTISSNTNLTNTTSNNSANIS
jgi:hypothetical protein